MTVHGESKTKRAAIVYCAAMRMPPLSGWGSLEPAMIKKKDVLLTAFLLAAGLSQGQILNIDRTDTSDYTRRGKINLQLNSGLEIDKQNTTLYDATNVVETMWQQNRELFILAGSYRFTYNGPDDILNAGYIHLRYRHGYKNRLQPEPFVQYQWDNKRGILERFLYGANLRYHLQKGNNFDFNAGAGPMYEREKWNYAGVDSSKIPANPTTVSTELLKINSYLRFDWKPNDHNDIAFTLFVQTRPDRFRPRVAPHIQWDIKAGKHFGFSISYSGLYDAAPVVPIDRFYYSLSNSLFLDF